MTDWELTTVREIEQLPIIRVQRVDDAKLKWMGMKPQQCHANAWFMEENDPERRSKQIIGWWPHDDGRYVLHSIVNHRGQLLCFTPVDENLIRDPAFNFIPDRKIEVRADGDVRSCYRNGVKIGPGVRHDPSQTIADCELARQRLLSGMDPYEAVRPP